MGLQPGTPIEEIAVDRVFIGSCTNSRLDDRAAARGRKGLSSESAACARWWCRDRRRIKQAAEKEGLQRIFQEAGFEWRESGCSMCWE